IEPDRAWCYSNADYVLLGEIVERITEAPLPVVLWQRILEPLGLRDTEYPLADPYVRSPHLPGYTRFAGRYHDTSVISPSESGASGAMISNASEVARFFEAVVHGDLVPSPWAARMRAAVPSQDGLGYGYGLSRLELPDGTIAYGHRGGTAGANTVVLATEAGRTVVLHQNALDLKRPVRWDNPFLLAALAVSLGPTPP
ncbi:MAG TPA: serine hydrolase domain-containing protein, partial [Micromonosporaceae bacterium]